MRATYRDYAALPNDGRRYEIHDGELSVTPAPSPWHQDVVLNFATVLRAHVSERGLGRVFVAPIDVILSDTSIVQPDIVYVLDRVVDRASTSTSPDVSVN